MIREAPELDILLTFKETCQYLRVSSATLYRLMDAEKIQGYKVGSTWRFYKTDVIGLVKEDGTEDARENERWHKLLTVKVISGKIMSVNEALETEWRNHGAIFTTL